MPAQSRSDKTDQARSYVVYDKETGRAVGRYRRYDMASDTFSECDAGEVLGFFAESDSVLGAVTDGAPDNLDVLETNQPIASLRSLRVETQAKRLVEQSRLHLAADRDELEGDGADTAQLSLTVYDRHGQVDSSREGRVRVTTTRGKLSARGGVVDLKEGRASLTLTSVPETVQRVIVRAAMMDGSAQKAEIALAFV